MTDPQEKTIRISQRDRDRYEAMAAFERDLADRGYKAVAGVDEAGRGPLAGPVLAAACILPAKTALYGLNDSKKMTPRRREVLYDQIRRQAVAWSIAKVDQEAIDRTNILSATKQAMKRALLELPVKPDLALIDAVALEGLDFPVLAKIQGDAHHNVIAAASILAKVARDRLMVNWDKIYPDYGFAAHKGYGTPAHMEALRLHGPCPLHRQSFLSSLDLKKPEGLTAYDKGWQTEWAVARDLIGRGHTILAHRYAVQAMGDIDFITAHKKRLYVIECKGRGPGTESFGGIESALREDQVRRIRRLADLWLASQPAYADWPLDLLYAAADLDRQGRLIKLDYLPF